MENKNVRNHNFIDRTGETLTMSNGLKATIIRYNNCDDISIQFENGQIVKKTRYVKFKRGFISCPMIYEFIDDYVKCTNPNTKTDTVFLINVEDYEKIKHRYWQKQECSNTTYILCRDGLLHRILMGDKKGYVIDHINGDGTDNRRNNLRYCTQQQNNWNSKIRNNTKSRYKGVTINKYSIYARIYQDGKKIYLGCFNTPQEAAIAYNEAAKKYRNEFAVLNKVIT